MTRTMHPALESWFAGLTQSDRNVMRALGREKAAEIEAGSDSHLSWLLAAVGAQIGLDVAREDTVLHELEAHQRAEVDAIAERLNLPTPTWAEFSSPNDSGDDRPAA